MSSQPTRAGPSKKELQGRRPPPLNICRGSHKIRKPAPAVPSVPSVPILDRPVPMIIYMQSPKVIHAEIRDFRSLVQRLTGSSSSSYTRSCSTKNENDTVNHDPMIISDASDVTTRSEAGEFVDDQNMGSFRSDDTACDPNTTSWENDSNQKIESRASAPEDTDRAQPAVTALGDSILISPFSPSAPNSIFPSQRLLSPRIFKDFPLFSPDSNTFFVDSLNQCSVLRDRPQTPRP